MRAGRRAQGPSASPATLAWRNGVARAYAASGLAFASWVSRLPAIRDALQLTPATVGLLLLCMSVGSFLSVSASGFVILRLGSRRTIQTGSALVGVSLLLVGLGSTVLASAPAAGAALTLLGLGTGSWNVASNVEGAAVERALRRHIMPRLHAAFSAGTVLGAGLGSLAAFWNVPVAWHLGVVGTVVVATVWTGARNFRADSIPGAAASLNTGPLETITLAAEPQAVPEPEAGPSPRGNRSLVFAAWRERRTLLLGLMVLGMALGEGAAGDWVALAMADGYRTSNAVGALAYGIFVVAMTLGRLSGTVLLDRHGRVVVLRLCASLAITGLAVFVFSPWQWLAMAALALWGLGVSLGFPVGMSAAADDPRSAAARVSVVSTIGYAAFLCGPPLLGLLGDRVGIRYALLAVLALVGVSLATAGSARRDTVEAWQK
ncbi:MFS transporter [Paenarthrobacter sp. DKR-5]|nr:MFS transporter [Paenarthrobacter sp. DKR-5]